MGSRKTPGSKDLSPFTHTSPGEPAVPHVITADNSVRGEGGIQCVCAAGRICYSLIPEEWQVPIVFILSLLHCHDSFPCLLGTGYDGFLFFLFFFGKFCFYSSYGLHCSSTTRGIMWQSAVAIFKCGINGCSFLVSFISHADYGGK